MNPDAPQLWRAPRWALALLLALLGMLGPFSIDTYLPAFVGMARSLGASPVQMQQTLSAYLFGFAFMSLFHGAISDSFGRRPVVLWGVAPAIAPIIGGTFLYTLSSPVFLGEHLDLAPTQFFWFFVLSIGGIMGGAWFSGRLAGKIEPKRQIRHGFVIMLGAAAINLVTNLAFKAHVSWALLPIAVFSFGWALMVPVVTLLVLDLNPERRGMASSLQMFIGSSANGLVVGVVVPLVMHSTVALAATSLAMLCVGLVAWTFVHWRWPADRICLNRRVAQKIASRLLKILKGIYCSFIQLNVKTPVNRAFTRHSQRLAGRCAGG